MAASVTCAWQSEVIASYVGVIQFSRVGIGGHSGAGAALRLRRGWLDRRYFELHRRLRERNQRGARQEQEELSP